MLPHRLLCRRSRCLISSFTFCFVACVALLNSSAFAQASAPGKPAPRPDTVVFTNGDQLTGKLLRARAADVTFHSDIVGDVTVPWNKIRTLDTAQPFAVIEKEDHLTRKTAADFVPLGAISIHDGNIHLQPAASGAPVKVFPIGSTAYLIDAASFHRELRSDSDLRYGWKGSVTLGAALVQGTNTNQTYTGAVNFVRTIPTLTWLPHFSTITFDLDGTYGLLKQPQIQQGKTVIQEASSAKTNILHGDLEYDKYVSSRFFWLVNATADHNYGSGLQVAHTYGAGVGWSAIRKPKETLDLKTDLHYQQQIFYNGTTSALGTPVENLIGVDLTETWTRILPHGLKANESVTASPAFNIFRAYSGVATAGVAFPIYKKFSFNLSSTDNYLADPPIGYQRNTFQFTGGITYELK